MEFDFPSRETFLFLLGISRCYVSCYISTTSIPQRVTFWFCPKSDYLMFDQVYREDDQHLWQQIDLL
jgi:hypothetical protein